jgi:hypothetical protein
MADRDTPVGPGDDGLSMDLVSELKQIGDSVMKEAAPGAIADAIIGAVPAVVPQEAPPQTPQQQPPPPAPSVDVPGQPGRPWWVWPAVVVVACICAVVIVFIIDDSGEGVVQDAGASTSPTPSPAEASTGASESPTPEEATSAAAPVEPSPDTSAESSTSSEAPALYEGEFVGLPRLTEGEEEKVVYVDLDVPQVHMTKPDDEEVVDFIYYKSEELSETDDGIYSWYATAGDLVEDHASADACVSAVRVNPMSNPREPGGIAVDDVFCVITSEGNVAAMTVESMGDSSIWWEIPAINLDVTLWEHP